jgi:S-adenosylmethionine synthetase
MKTRNIVVYAAERSGEAPVEMCEHKSRGHPDTITDAVCEAVALALVRAYQAVCGGPLHFNVDKGLLVGGRSEPRLGGGRVLERPKLIVAGRASNPQGRLDMPSLVTEAAAEWLDANLAPGSSFFQLFSEVRQGSADLRRVIAESEIRANDTSFGVGYAPLSALEEKVLALAALLGSPGLRDAVPAAGQDFKVMGQRSGREFSFTVAIALIDRHVRSCEEYFAAKERIRVLLGAENVLVNRLDDPRAQDESGIYLTVTGLSAEMGDDGQVGRGNRVNGLITPDRPMSLEAAAGKNPYSHVGKIYNVLAHRLAHTICEQIPEAKAANVRLLSAIGQPLDEPLAAAVEIAGGASPAVRERVRRLVDEQLDSLPDFLAELSRGRLRVY